MRATLLKSWLLFNFIHLARAIRRSFTQSMWDPANWMRGQQTKSLIWDHKTPLHSQSNHGRCRWIFYKKPQQLEWETENYAACDVDLCSIFLLRSTIPSGERPGRGRRRRDRERERERERRMTCGFILGFFVLMWNQREALTEMWQIPAMSKNQQARTHSNLSGEIVFW